ncbi:MAG: ATP-binding cassette domain-containing protein [Succinivibrionaceae bacterium]|nr:ATP-binding cassette domain-containing protein [Succinivibrionaceae bacterium]
MITFADVGKVYPCGQCSALQNISFTIDKGEVVFLTGHSGAGKSTVLRIISGLEKATAGRVYFEEQDVTSISRSELPFYRRHIGMIFQDHKLMMNRTVAENVALPLLIREHSMAYALPLVEQALSRVGILSKINAYPQYLSAGEQQRVGIARAMIGKPDVLLADEPTGNLDRALSIEILELFLALNREEGMTVVMATHDLELVSLANRRCLELQNGRLVLDTKGQ